MTSCELVLFTGLGLAAWGHLLVHERRVAEAVWVRLDGLFPAMMRTPPRLAGGCLLAIGTLCVLVSMVAPAAG